MEGVILLIQLYIFVTKKETLVLLFIIVGDHFVARQMMCKLQNDWPWPLLTIYMQQVIFKLKPFSYFLHFTGRSDNVPDLNSDLIISTETIPANPMERTGNSYHHKWKAFLF